MKELTQMRCDLEEKGGTSELLPLQLEDVFCRLLPDGYSEKGGQRRDLNQKSPTTPEVPGEEPHILEEFNSKEKPLFPKFTKCERKWPRKLSVCAHQLSRRWEAEGAVCCVPDVGMYFRVRRLSF